MHDFLQPPKAKTSMNMTPLVDVIFILLIFFMISTQFRTTALPMKLPQAGNTTIENSDNRLLVVDKNGAVFLDDEKMNLEELEIRFSGLDQELGVTLAGDSQVEFERIVHVLDVLQKVGVDDVSIRHDALRD